MQQFEVEQLHFVNHRKPTVQCPNCRHIWMTRRNRTSNLFRCPHCKYIWRRKGNIFGVNITSRYKTGEYYCINCSWVTKISLDKGKAPRCAKCGERVRTGPRQTRSDAEKQRKWRRTQ